ncbi:response regulator [Oryzomonas japonica]|uniref:Response regulator n=1 Tax=Oryzomonas japonica TaxID=2603858 RepID=A0A7J4ZPC0_9BACT|nr:response regulator [Oryzomonas japonica]KAB0664746.1 response regulator [Oryzomonas japonica]
MTPPYLKPAEILLVEDNPADVRLTMEVLKDAKLCNNISVVNDGVQALDFLYRRGEYGSAARPDIILLDLNLPRLDGREVLERVKGDDSLKHIPVVVLTTSSAEQDILKSYALHANCYITKPVDLEQFTKVVTSIEEFWFSIVKLPGM